ALDRLEGFTSLHGPAFYGLPVNDTTLTLTKGAPVTYPSKIEVGAETVTVFDPGFPLHWTVTA
ncbi:dihydroorotase, partial [Falsihalocynthiibacter sp. S25ZX9]